MDVYDAIVGRRSIRTYLLREVPRGHIQKMLEAAHLAPSGGNLQPWKFLVVTDRKVLDMIRSVSPGILGKPPAAIVVCLDRRRASEFGEELERDYTPVIDCALATENLVLVAYSLGLATCIVRSFAGSAVSELLDLPEHISPELIVTVGYPSDVPKAPPKLSLKDLAYADKFGRPWEAE